MRAQPVRFRNVNVEGLPIGIALPGDRVDGLVLVPRVNARACLRTAQPEQERGRAFGFDLQIVRNAEQSHQVRQPQIVWTAVSRRQPSEVIDGYRAQVLRVRASHYSNRVARHVVDAHRRERVPGAGEAIHRDLVSETAVMSAQELANEAAVSLIPGIGVLIVIAVRDRRNAIMARSKQYIELTIREMPSFRSKVSPKLWPFDVSGAPCASGVEPRKRLIVRPCADELSKACLVEMQPDVVEDDRAAQHRKVARGKLPLRPYSLRDETGGGAQHALDVIRTVICVVREEGRLVVDKDLLYVPIQDLDARCLIRAGERFLDRWRQADHRLAHPDRVVAQSAPLECAGVSAGRTSEWNGRRALPEPRVRSAPTPAESPFLTTTIRPLTRLRGTGYRASGFVASARSKWPAADGSRASLDGRPRHHRTSDPLVVRRAGGAGVSAAPRRSACATASGSRARASRAAASSRRSRGSGRRCGRPSTPRRRA